MKLWDRGEPLHPVVERFTVGNDHEIDHRLVAHDCEASAAHARMLCRIGVIDEEELSRLELCLAEIAEMEERGEFRILLEDEDCHTAIERHLCSRLGETGRRIHAGRSRNDQVLTALRLYEKKELDAIKRQVVAYSDALDGLAGRWGSVPLPGYTHMRKAMPTTVGTWIGAFAAAAIDDQRQLDAALHLVDQSPLGTAAGFGVPLLQVDRSSTAHDLGFGRVMHNPMYAQLSRGKFEAVVLGACSQIMFDLNRLATDLMLFTTSEFGFASLPQELTTGSSIMPQKRNPDVLELVRARYHIVLAEELKTRSLCANLMSGYNRDVQLTKEPLFAGIEATRSCLEVMCLLLDGVRFDEDRCRAALTGELFATERVHELVLQGVPLRDAYGIVARSSADQGAAAARGS